MEQNYHLIEEIIEKLQAGSSTELCELVQQAINAGISANEILNEGLLKGMALFGEDFKNGLVFIPDVLLVSRAMTRALDLLKPCLVQDDIHTIGTVVIGTVFGDIHSIGKNLVKIMMESYGLNVIDLGENICAERFCEAAIEYHADIVACSALLTSCAPEMKAIVQLFEQKGLRNKVKIMIGGNAVTQRFCNAIGADYYTTDASSAADLARTICLEKHNRKDW